MLGRQPMTDTLNLIEGDSLWFTLTMEQGGPVPLPVTFWWPDENEGTTVPLTVDDAGSVAFLSLSAEQVLELIRDWRLSDGTRAPQLDVGTVYTVYYDKVIIHANRGAAR